MFDGARKFFLHGLVVKCLRRRTRDRRGASSTPGRAVLG